MIYNLRRRNKRKNLREVEASNTDQCRIEPKNKAPAQLSKIDELRQLVAKVSAEPVIPAVKSLVYRDDYGRIITERQ